MRKKTKDKMASLERWESEEGEGESYSVNEQTGTVSSSESEDIDNDADLDQMIEQRLQYTIQQYNIQQQKVEEKINRYNENPEKQLVFMFIPNFDQGANFLYYQTQNNMNDVIYELDLVLRQNQEFRARANTNYE